MNTPSHFVMTAALRKALPRLDMPRGAVWLGSVMPDLPLYLMALGAMGYFHYALGWPWRETHRHMWEDLYFHHPGWVGPHNFFHAPIVLCVGLVAARWLNTRRPALARRLKWFLLACLLHSVVDILTHHDDGPLIFWPLNWSYRWHSPVSYWDSSHYGAQFSRFELSLFIILTVYLTGPWLWKKLFRRKPQTQSGET